MVYNKRASTLTLQQLNADCLLHIFRALGLREQYALWQLHPHFEMPILYIWRRKYATTIDCDEEELCKLHKDERKEVICLLSGHTKTILNLNAAMCHTLAAIASSTNGFSRISEISYEAVASEGSEMLPALESVQWHMLFPHLQRLQLRCMPLETNTLMPLSNLNDLQLVNCHLRTASNQLGVLFRQLRLQHFVCVSTPQHAWHANSLQLSGIHRCRTLLTLQVGVVELSTALLEVAKLPTLQKLTVFTNTTALVTMRQHCHIVAALAKAKAAQIAAIRLKCHFDRYFVQQLLYLPNLRAFRWHSHFHADYIPHNEGHAEHAGVIMWQSFDMLVPQAILLLIATHRNCLKELDLRWNCHVQQTFLDKLRCVLRIGNGSDCHVQWSQAALMADPMPYTYSKLLEELGYFEFEFE